MELHQQSCQSQHVGRTQRVALWGGKDRVEEGKRGRGKEKDRREIERERKKENQREKVRDTEREWIASPALVFHRGRQIVIKPSGVLTRSGKRTGQRGKAE